MAHNTNDRPKITVKSLSKHLLQLVVGIALIGILISVGGSDGLQNLGQIAPLPAIGALLATLVITGSIAARWGTLANTLAGRQVTTWLNFYHYFIVSRLLGFLLPKDVTDLGSRTICLTQFHGVSLPKAAASVLLDRLFDLMTAGIFLLAVLPFWIGLINTSQSVIIMIGMAIGVAGLLWGFYHPLLALAKWTFQRSLWIISKLPIKQPSQTMPSVFESVNRPLALKLYGFSVLKFAATAGRMILFAQALNLPISPALILLTTPIGQFTYVFAFTPGGLGILEAGWFAALTMQAVLPADATAFVVGQRILTVVFIGVLTLCSQIVHYVTQTMPSKHPEHES